ncbi:MAG: hypothetical protein JXR72_06450 [Proteobacteria bacterium]|nr:hypothetical protein [Pseudomonadota bacterium]
MKRDADSIRETRMKARRITAMGWGLFFLWLGLVLVLDAGIGLILLGVGFISLGMQIARKYAGLESDGFWILVAILFVLVGAWELFEMKMPLMAVLLMVVGVGFLVSATRKSPPGK